MFSKTIIMGRLTKDPELKQTPNGVSVCTFSVAVDRAYAPKGGERKADFYNVVAWRQTGEFVSRYFFKGSAILVEGSMECRYYEDKNSVKRQVWELVAGNVSFTGSKKESSGGGDSYYGNAPPEGAEASGQPLAPSTSQSDCFVEVDDDGDLPF